jgi:hypothetical protein
VRVLAVLEKGRERAKEMEMMVSRAAGAMAIEAVAACERREKLEIRLWLLTVLCIALGAALPRLYFSLER